MGTFDISRINFDAKKHYVSARMQQGRVLTDDDWNEAKRISEHLLLETNIDIIGPYGTPDDGFKIDNLKINASLIDFDIKAGTMYLGGLKLDLEALETFRLQKDWLEHKITNAIAPIFTSNEQYDLVYMEAWQQAVSAVEDSSLYEVALGGPDTTTRLRNMRRVKLASSIGFCHCIDAWDKLKADFAAKNKGVINSDYERIADTKLKVTFSDTGLPEDLCTPNAAGGYLGAENQAIRVQIVDETHFNWGFDNSSPYYRVSLAADGTTVTMHTEPKDQYHWPLTNQIVEILPWSAVLPNGEKIATMAGHLSKVNASFNPDTAKFTLQTALPAAFGQEWKNRADFGDLDNQTPQDYFYMRVWNRGSDLSSAPAISFTTDTAVALGNTGLKITISGTDRQSNDYWVIAARPETPTRVVPWDLEIGITAHGVRRYFAPLAVIKWTKDIQGNVVGEIFHDCRKKFHPLTEQECCCTFTVGDGKTSHGDFDNIQEAVDNLPANGGKICVLSGEHFARVIIKNKRQIRIMGCGDQSLVMPLKQNERINGPVFLIENSQKIQIDQLTIFSQTGVSIAIIDERNGTASENITINENRIIAGIHGVYVKLREDIGGDNLINISYNKIGIIDTERGKEAIFSLADGVLIERNRIVVIPAPNKEDPNDPRDPENPGGDPFDPCKDPLSILKVGFSTKYTIYILVKYISIYYPHIHFFIGYKALGGIQIGGTSERVRILENEIIGGKGNGITLGNLLKAEEKYHINSRNTNYTYSPLYEISIEGNHILSMGLSGISTLLDNIESVFFVIIHDFTAYRNLIRNCARQLPDLANMKDLDKNIAFGGIILSDCMNGRIQENRIEGNGLRIGDPICGVFVFNGEEMDISTNSIINNGLPIIEIDTLTLKGNRGGIVVKMTFKAVDFKNLLEAKTPSFDGVPSIKVHDNIVLQPVGFALYLMAFGPVSVVSNQFTSLGPDTKNMQSLLATTVFIFNLGISKDMFVIAFKNIGNSTKEYESLINTPSFQKIFKALQYLPNGKVMFTNNQTTLDVRQATINLSLSSQLIASLDDVAFNTNQSECAGYLSLTEKESTIDMVLINTFLFGVSVRSNDNRFSDGLTLTFFSLLSIAYMNTATGNQSTHCLNVLGTLLAKNSNLVLSDSSCSEREAVVGKNFGF